MQSHRMKTLAEYRDDIAVYESDNRGFLFRPGSVLVALADEQLVVEDLAAVGAKRVDVSEEGGVARYQVSGDIDIGAFVTRLRRRPDGTIAEVGPEHVFAGEPNYHGGPADFPDAVEEPRWDESRSEGTVRVTVLDTGYARGIHRWLDAQTDSDAADEEVLDDFPPAGALDDESGHGVFIAGVIARRAPAARVRAVRVLDSEGYVGEVDLAVAIARNADCDVMNLSLGGYTHRNNQPVALATALRRLEPRTAVVAAAGNNASRRPMWPGAFKSVIAVGALNAKGRKARFSNYGPWVDACAPGVDVVSAFIQFEETADDDGRPPQTYKGWARWSGTSFAAPVVTAEIAAAYAGGNYASAAEAAQDLIRRAGTRLGNLGAVIGA